MSQIFYFYFYSCISLVALIVHVIINWPQMANWRGIRARAGALEFRLFLIGLSFFFLSDILWGVFAEWQYLRVLYVDTVVFFLLLAFVIHSWMRFVIAYLKMEGAPRTCLLWSGRAMLAFFVVTLCVNHFNGCFFTIDEKDVFVCGPMRTVALLLMIAFNALTSVLTLCAALRTEGARRRRNVMVFIFGATSTVAVLLQFPSPLLPIYALGYLFGCCLLHVFVFEDERDEMHRNELRASAYEAQLEAERVANQAKSLFFSSVSHDIRTPLNAIIGFSELLENGVSDEEDRKRYIASIRSSSKVLARLVDDILDLSKMESGKLDIIQSPTDVPALVREVIAACEVARSRKSLALKAEIAQMPYVSVDPQRIRQILFNLLSNAYKYTDRGTVAVRVRWQDGTLTLSVADTGKGISQENMKRILQPFVQVADRNHRDGTGLGLPICQKLVALMGGELTIDSEVGKGSTFTVTLPDVKTAAPPDIPDGETGRIARSGPPPSRVLVVDDSPVNRAVLKALLAKLGVHDVTLASNGREALGALKGETRFDLVLSDLWMPEMDGRELVHAIRADAAIASLPVYLVTADVEARTQAAANGFTGVLLKPITLERLKPLFA